EQLFDLRPIQAGGGLIQDQQLSRDTESASNRDQLLNGNRIGGKLAVDIKGKVEPRQRCPRSSGDRTPTNYSKPGRLAAEADVFGNGQVWDQVNFLIHRADAKRLRLARRSRGDDLTF